MKHLSFMIKPASALCNLRCQYCFYADVSSLREVESFGIMSQSTTDAVLANIFASVEPGDSVAIAFQGGEPTLAGLSYFRHFVSQAQLLAPGVSISYALQTNGIVLNEEWCAFLKEHHFLVGLSLDGYAEQHDKNRLDTKGDGTFTQVLAAKHLMDTAKVEYNILCTLTNELARFPQKVWQFILDEDIRFIQFTPCLGKLDGKKDEWMLTPRRFYSFYKALFSLWKQEVFHNNYISIKLFDDIVNLFVRRQITACGMHGQCQLQYIIEGDGGVYPCDFYVLDTYRGGNLSKAPLPIITQNLEQTGFLTDRAPLPKVCEQCNYFNACHGGCKRLFPSMYVDKTGFCGYRKLLSDIGQELCDIGGKLIQISSQ